MTSRRLVTYESSTTSPAPTQAVITPSSSVFRIAACVALYSKKVNEKLASVRLSQPSGWAQARDTDAFASTAYGRKIGHAITASTARSAGHREAPSAIVRRWPPLPPTAA